MTPAPPDLDLATTIARRLPYMRRYARALCGSQVRGDAMALRVLDAILADPRLLEPGIDPSVALFRVLNDIWSASDQTLASDDSQSLAARAQVHLAGLTPGTREALLLSSIERLGPDDIAQVLRTDTGRVADLIQTAHEEMAEAVAGRVLVIEDEAAIANDIETIVTGMGHDVTGTARTRTSAVAMAQEDEPDLILADIQLADDSSGIDAVNEILAALPGRPVIFITAFPERFLTGERPEPAFLITKPYTRGQVRSAVSQAMFFASTETLA